MAFDESKDKMLQEWRSGGLVVSVRQYNDGARKLQIGPREVEKKDGEMTHRKAGRLSGEEWTWLESIAVEIGKVIANG